DVVGENGAVLRGRDREREDVAVRLGGDVVVEHRGASQSPAAQAGKPLDCAPSTDDTPGGQAVCRRYAAISSGGNEAIDEEAGAHRNLSTCERAIERDREGKRPDRVRRDSRDGPPFAYRLARAAEIERLQISQSAVNRSEM